MHYDCYYKIEACYDELIDAQHNQLNDKSLPTKHLWFDRHGGQSGRCNLWTQMDSFLLFSLINLKEIVELNVNCLIASALVVLL